MQCWIPGDSNNAAQTLEGITNGTLGNLEGIFPPSKAELRYVAANLHADNADLQTEVASLEADNANLRVENTRIQALLNAVILQVNKLTPVSIRILFRVLQLLQSAESLGIPSQCDYLTLQGYNDTNGLNGVNGTTGAVEYTGKAAVQHPSTTQMPFQSELHGLSFLGSRYPSVDVGLTGATGLKRETGFIGLSCKQLCHCCSS